MANFTETTFFFRKESIRDADGVKIGEGVKLPNLTVNLPKPTIEEIIVALGSGGAVATVLQDAVFNLVYLTARAQINSWREENPAAAEVPASAIDLTKLTLEEVAAASVSDARGGAISEEQLESFYSDYKEVMPVAAGKTAAQVDKQLSCFKSKFAGQKSDKPVLELLLQLLNVWKASTQNFADNAVVYEALVARATKLLTTEPKKLLELL